MITALNDSILIRQFFYCRSIPAAKKLRHASADDAQPIPEVESAAALAPQLNREQVAALAAGARIHSMERGMEEGADVEGIETAEMIEAAVGGVADDMADQIFDDQNSEGFSSYSDAVLEAVEWYSLDDPKFWEDSQPQDQGQAFLASLVGSGDEEFSLDEYVGL